MKKRTAAIMVGIIVVLLLSIVIWSMYYGNSSGRYGGVTWTLTHDGTLIISGEGGLPDFRDPESTSSYRTYKPEWDKECVKTVIIEEGVTSIGDYTFWGLNDLTDITISNSVTSIGEGAFKYCDFADITLPDSITEIGEYAFAKSGLTELELPSSLTDVKSFCFFDCDNLISVKIPASATEINVDAFTECDNLKEIIVDVYNPNYSSDENGVLYSKDKRELICVPFGFGGNLTLHKNVREIPNYSFDKYSSISKIKFLDNAPKFGNTAFTHMEITAYYPKDNSTWLGHLLKDYNGEVDWQPYDSSMDVYGECGDNLTYSFTFDGVLTISGKGEIGDYTLDDKDGEHWLAFRDEIKSIVIEDGVTRIGDNAFCYCSTLSEVVIPESVESIGENSFYCCDSLLSIKIPASVTLIENGALNGCYNLKNIDVAKDNPNYSIDERNVLYNKDGSELIYVPDYIDGSYTVSANVTMIREDAFADSFRLNRIIVAEENQYYSSLDGALYNKDKSELIKVPRFIQRYYTIPESVVKIKANAFADCDDLPEFRFKGDAPSFESEIVFDEKATIYYPENNATWDEVIENYTGDATWVAQTPSNSNYNIAIIAVVGLYILFGAGFIIYKLSAKRKKHN